MATNTSNTVDKAINNVQGLSTAKETSLQDDEQVCSSRHFVCMIVRATPKSNSVDNVRALQGDAMVLEDAIKL